MRWKESRVRVPAVILFFAAVFGSVDCDTSSSLPRAPIDSNQINQELQCMNDLGWYFHYVSQLVADVSATPVSVTIFGSTVANFTVGDIWELVKDEGENLLQVVEISVSHDDRPIFSASVDELMDIVDGSASFQDFVSNGTFQINGEQILDVTFTVNASGTILGQTTVGDLVPQVNVSAENLEFLTNLIENGVTLDVVDGVLLVNDVPIEQILDMFGLTTIGPGIDFWGWLQIDIPAPEVTMPPAWVIQMLDASGIKSPPPNFLRGNFFNFGNFQQCMNVKASEDEEISGSYRFQRLAPTTFGGQYCMLTVHGRNHSVPEATSDIVYGAGCSICLVSGACFPDSCDENMLQKLVPLYVQQVFGVGSNISTCSLPGHQPLSKVEIGTTVFIGLILLVLIAGTFLDLTESKPSLSEKPKQDSKAIKCLKAFSIKKNTKAILATKTHGDVIDCLFGIRFLSMLWVLLGHTYSHGRRAFQMDPLDYFEKLRTFSYQPVMNGYPSVDTFFFISGLLASYLMLKNLTKEGNDRWFFAKLYMHRYLRITPLYATVILVSYAFFERVNSGPLWPTVYDIFLKSCETTWWHNLLYISTILRPVQECVLHGWYLTDDMIYFILSPILIVPLYLHATIGMAWIFLAFLASIATPALIHHHLQVPGVMTWKVLNDDRVNRYMDFVYYRPHTRFGVYVVGIAAGYFLHVFRGKRIKLPKMIVWSGWVLSTITGILVVYGTYEYMYFDKEMDEYLAVMYGSMHHQAFGFAVGWVIFACAKGYGGFINTFLSWSAFKPLSNLSYASYLVHWYVIVWNVYGAKTQKQMDVGMQTFNFIGNVIITHLLAFCAAVAIEFPFGRLFGILLETKPRQKRDYYSWKAAAAQRRDL